MRSRVYHLDGNQEKLGALAARYGSTVDVRVMVRDGRMLLSAAGGADIERVERELGLTPLQEYLRAGRSLAGLALRRNRG